METTKRGVFYTDGSFSSSKQAAGWGVHGYLYNTEISVKKSLIPGWDITPQGYVSHEQTNQGLIDKHWEGFPETKKGSPHQDVETIAFIDAIGGTQSTPTNNRAELAAVLVALDIIEQQSLSYAWIYSDSQYVIEGINTRSERWEANDWKKDDGELVANIDLWKQFIEKRKAIQSQCTTIFRWIKGHAKRDTDSDTDHFGNEKSDKLANLGMLRAAMGEYTPLLTQLKAKEYLAIKAEPHPLISHKRWYFNVGQGIEDSYRSPYWIYYLGEHGKDDDFLGKRESDTSFSVVALKHPEPVFQQVIQAQRAHHDREDFALLIGRLDYLFKSNVYYTIEHFGGLSLKRPTQKLDLYSEDNLQLTKELRPPRLAFNVIEVMEVLEGLLFETLNDASLPGLVVTDITSYFYSEAEGKKTKTVMCPEFTMQTQCMSLPVQTPFDSITATVKLTVGLDTPRYPTFRKLCNPTTRVLAVTWRESPQAFRYGTIIQTPTGVGIYSNYYANLHILRSNLQK